MSEKKAALDQKSIDEEVRNHLTLIIPFLERLGFGSSTHITAGYVEFAALTKPETLTDLGLSLLSQAQRVAWDSAAYLYELTTERDVERGAHDALLNDVQGFLAITACALEGVETDAHPGVSPTWVAWHLYLVALELRKRAEVEDRKQAPMPVPKPSGSPGLQERGETTPDQLSSGEARGILLDAFRPLATYLHAYRYPEGGADLEELARGLHTAVGLACESIATAGRLSDVVDFEDIPGIDPVVLRCLLGASALALEAAVDRPDRISEVQDVARLVSDAYDELLAVPREKSAA